MIREAAPADLPAICALHRAAFGGEPEAELVERLHTAGGARLSWLVEETGQIVSHVLFSGLVQPIGWLALAPVATAQSHRRQGHASALIRQAIEVLRPDGWHGIVVLGDPAFYGRFGFETAPDALISDFPRPALQTLSFGPQAIGPLQYPSAFDGLD